MSKNKKDDRLKQVEQEGDEKPEVYGIVKDRQGFRIGRRAFFGSLGIGMLTATTGYGAAGKSVNAEPCSSLKAHSGSVTSLAISPDGKMLASGSWDKTIRLWDLPEGTPGPCLFDPALTEKGTKVGEYRQMGETRFTLPCGSPTPAGATYICDCVAGSGQYSRTETVCICDTIMVPAGSPIPAGGVCVCNTIAVGTYTKPSPGGGGYGGHYWYPN
jgi:hypothetical protein